MKAALAALLLAAGCAFSLEGELPEIEIAHPDVRIPGVPGDLPDGEAVSLPFVPQIHARLGLPPEAYSEVRVHEVRVVLKTGANDLSFLRSLRVTMSGLEGLAGGAAVEIARYERAPGAEVGPALSLQNRPPADVTEPWRSSTQVVVLEATGALPETAWTADFTIRLSARLRY